MNCLKCGREIDADQVFCHECLFEMEKYPVKPNIAVQLPPRREQPSQKKAHIKNRVKPPLEEQVKNLKKHILILSILLIVCLVLLAAFYVPTYKHLRESHFLPGQNYSAVDTSSSTGTE